jgi:hypothetical protein
MILCDFLATAGSACVAAENEDAISASQYGLIMRRHARAAPRWMGSRNLCVASILLAAASASAATITVRPQTTDRPIVVAIEGALVASDEAEFIAKASPLPSAFVGFSSDSGSLVAGLRIGEAIRRKRFSTFVPDGRRCASACALAWLAGVERFIGTDALIRFHPASDAASGEEIGITNPVVDTYLAKIGLPYRAATYVTQVAPSDIGWLNMSDVAERGIRVTLLSSLANETVIAIPTRYGDVLVTRDDPVCCTGHITHRDQRMEIASTGRIYATLEGVYRVKEGDLIVISFQVEAGAPPATHHLFLVDQEGMTDLTVLGFGSLDGTFKASQRDDEVYFDLGLREGKKKSAIYKNRTLAVHIRSLGAEAILPKSECATILNMVETCVRLPKCNDERIFENFAMAGQRYFNRLEEMTVFTSRNFYNVCSTICTSKSYVAKRARGTLCGY